jgi:hypothetical protein
MDGGMEQYGRAKKCLDLTQVDGFCMLGRTESTKSPALPELLQFS